MEKYTLTIEVDEAKLREAMGDKESPVEFLIRQKMGLVEDSGIHLTITEKLLDYNEYADELANSIG